MPRKNALEIVKGVSLLEWTIRQAHSVYPVQDVIVSTEDHELAHIAKSAGAHVLCRPVELARDDTSTSAVVDDIVQRLDPGAVLYGAVSILQVTSPLRLPEDISESVRMIGSRDFDSVISGFLTTSCHPAKLYYINESESGSVALSAAPSIQHARRQDLPKVYRRNGAIFTVTREHFDKTGQLWGGRMGLVIMPQSRSLDIDTPTHLARARAAVRRTKRMQR